MHTQTHTEFNLPICVSLHFCGTATVPPMWKTFRARSVATVNTADFSAGPQIKLERSLWEDNEAGPKIEAQISSIFAFAHQWEAAKIPP